MIRRILVEKNEEDRKILESKSLAIEPKDVGPHNTALMLLIECMFDTLAVEPRGLAISANQLGMQIRD